jgi:hypothetical protein
MELNYDNVISLAAPLADGSDEHHLYALVDHGAMPDLIVQMNKFKLNWTSLFKGSRDEGALEVAPILVPIRSGEQLLPSKTVMNWLLKQGRYSSSLLFLYSPLDTADLARRLAMRLDVSLPEGIEMLLRFFDGRVFETLLKVLQAEQRLGFLSPARAWWLVDRVGHLRLCDSCFSAIESPLIPIVLNTAQEAALIDASEIDQVAMLLSAMMPSEFESKHEVERVSFLTKNIASARSYRIVAPNDLTMYCAMALTYGDGFDQVSPWVSWLAKISEGVATMNDAMQSDHS